jgi:hypothetical protein
MKQFGNTLRHFALPMLLILITTNKSAAQHPQGLSLPVPDHIVVVIMENHNYSQIYGSSAAPHINALANDDHSALFTQSFAIEHPSQPNYLDLYAGCNQGVTDDSKPANIPFTTANMGRELLDAGRTFITYSEDLPSVGYDGSSSGNYARKHNPAANWMGTGANQIPTSTNQPLTAFPTDYTKLPTVCFVVPNLKDDMHDGGDPGGIIIGDNWIYAHINDYVQWAKTHNSVLILTFDENETAGPNQIVTIFSGERVKAGKYSESISHYSVLATMETLYGLTHACNAASATTIVDCWSLAGVASSSDSRAGNVFALFPNPAHDVLRLSITKEFVGTLESITITNMLGKTVYASKLLHTTVQQLEIGALSAGIYHVSASDGKTLYTQKLIVP